MIVCAARLPAFLPQPRGKLLRLHFEVRQYLLEQARADSLARVNRNHCDAAISVPQEMVAPFNAHHNKTSPLECRNNLSAAKTRQPRHNQTAIR